MRRAATSSGKAECMEISGLVFVFHSIHAPERVSGRLRVVCRGSVIVLSGGGETRD
jgi:hypothetical protein